MAITDLLTNLRQHLITQNIVRLPSVAGSVPPMWLEPQLGTPAPGEGDNTEPGDPVLGAYWGGGIPPRPFESFFRTRFVDMRIRASNAGIAAQLEQQITSAIADRRNWTMGSMTVIDCEQFRDLQRIGSDEQGFDFSVEYAFWTYVGA